MTDTMQGLDFATTKVLLIGASEFPNDPGIIDIPNVAVNIKQLSALLKDVEVMGIPEANITISLNERKDEVETKLNRIVKTTNTKEHTLIVYYTGHGMYSSHNSSFYLATSHTTEEDLEALGVKGDVFKDYIRRSAAGRKIVIFDCCYSGKLLETMDTEESRKVALLNGFAGTYAMASSASDEPSLFPILEKERPTYFTEKLLEGFNGGIDNGNEYCSLNDIFCHIEQALMQDGRPRPLQSVYKTVGEIGLCKNKKFIQGLLDYEKAWHNAVGINTILGYTTYVETFSDTSFTEEALVRIAQIEEDEKWEHVRESNSIAAILKYIQTRKSGKYIADAKNLLNSLKEEMAESNKTKLSDTNLVSVEKHSNIVNSTSGKEAEDSEIGTATFTKATSDGELKKAIALYDSGNYKESFILFSNLASLGNHRAQNYLGYMHQNGLGVLQDYKLAFEWYQKSAEQGNALGQTNLGYNYEKGLGVVQDYKAALEWHRKSAEQGNAMGQTNLGYMYEKGLGVVQDYKLAFEWHRKSAEQGNAFGQTNLGYMYERGLGVVQDYKLAFEWYQKSAEQGYALGQNNLGTMYREGLGVLQDYKLAFEWHRKSAEQGNALGQNNLGHMYHKGLGVVQDYKLAHIAAKQAEKYCGIDVLFF
jgi:TPR repeat protein